MNKEEAYILWFDQIRAGDTPIVGGKNANLGEMYSVLTEKGLNVPNGFCLTAKAYWDFLDETGLRDDIKRILSDLDTNDIKNLRKRGEKVRESILEADLPEKFKKELNKAYRNLCEQYSENTDTAVRSSATAEDLPGSSFAGQQETYLNVKGTKELQRSAKKCIASLFTDRAISYREDKGFSHFDVALSVGVQKMVRSDQASSGVMFTIDTETGFENAIYITSSWGLGEMVVQGKVSPDEFYVFKPALEQGYRSIISKNLGAKRRKIIYDRHGAGRIKEVPVETEEQKKFSLTDDEILTLARWGKTIEDHFSNKAGQYQPMDIEWGKDGKTDELFILQARPETVYAIKEKNKIRNYKLKESGKVLVRGQSVGKKIGSGKVNVIKDVSGIESFRKDEILVTEMTDPDWEPIMKKASGIITNKGGRTCFAGKTKVLTDKGFFPIQEVHERQNEGEDFKILSYDHKKGEPKWKNIKSTQKNKLDTIKVSVSQTGRAEKNTIELTPDHKMYTFDKRNLTKKPINKILKEGESLCLIDKLPAVNKQNKINKRKAYLLGALASDGCVSFWKNKKNVQKGSITFTQKETARKKEFINTVNSHFEKEFQQSFTPRKKTSTSQIRARTVTGTATDFRCFKLKTAKKLQKLLDNLPSLSLNFKKETALNFLAGLIDGDGSFHKNRIQIYISDETNLRAAVISCLRLGIVPQVTTNRNIYNLQIVEKMDAILAHSKKIKTKTHKKKLGTKLMAAKQLFGDIPDKVNYKGRIKPYIKKNLLLDTRKIKENILPKLSSKLKEKTKKVLNSNLRMQRVNLQEKLGQNNVYNIEVEANEELDHNFVVFTKRYSPLLVSNSHAAIVSRELGIPAIVGSDNATQVLKSGQDATISCSEGEEGKVYDGKLDFEIQEYELEKIPETKTKIMVNIGSPGIAFENHNLPVDGVGLAREEFIIASQIKIHPNALLNYDQIEDGGLKSKIDKLTRGYEDKKEYFVEKLSFGIAKIAAAFWPDPVIVRFSDFKTNEYKSLIGGKKYEPKEENPMLGWRGASRYYNPKFQQAFGLECKAIKRTREILGLKNINVMVPFCRTPEEGREVRRLMAKFGLEKNEKEASPMQIYVMCEIPSNILSADKFLEIFDGFSIGSNDLTQLTMGVDRDSEIVADIADERNPALKKLVSEAIQKCKEHEKYSGICGQAPSDYDEFAKFLVKEGIKSISLSPDTVVRIIPKIAEWEKGD